MDARLPSVRQPRTFFDVFGVVAVTICVVAAVLTVWQGTIVRFEMIAVAVLVFGWAVWAMNRILERSIEHSDRSREGGRNW